MKFKRVWKLSDPITPIESFTYWYLLDVHGQVNVFEVVDSKGYSKPIGSFNWRSLETLEDLVNMNVFSADTVGPIIVDFQRFIEGRPEGSFIPLIENAVEEPISPQSRYEILLYSCLYHNDNPGMMLQSADIHRYELADRAITWLNSTDFFVAPSSTQYHDSYTHGLLIHSLRVVGLTYQLLQCPLYINVPAVQAITCALVHDWCKINAYEKYIRHVKDESGTWQDVEAFKHKSDAAVPLGHGAASLWIAQKFFKFTLEQSCAIRWHMGKWRTCDADDSELQSANERFPMVHLIQFADQLSITQYTK